MSTPEDIASDIFAPQDSLWTALAAIQADAPTLQRIGLNEGFKDKRGNISKYVTLEHLMRTVLPVLSKYGLVWVTKPVAGVVVASTGEPIITPGLEYELRHVASGESVGGTMGLSIPSTASPQQQGSAITYARRYSLMCVLGLVAEPDDDGQRASQPSGDDRKLTQTQRQKVWDELAATLEGQNADLWLASIGVTHDNLEWTRADALRIRAALDQRNKT